MKGARAAWNDWIELARATEVRALVTAASQIEQKPFGILNAMCFRAFNGLAEAINNQIRALKVRSRGFRNKERFKSAEGGFTSSAASINLQLPGQVRRAAQLNRYGVCNPLALTSSPT